MWSFLADWGPRIAVLSGLLTTGTATLSYLDLTPVTQRQVKEEIGALRREVVVGRADTLDTRRTVLHLYRNDLIRERQAVEGALTAETNPMSKSTWGRRLETINTEIDRIDRQVGKLDDQIEEIRRK